jgi:hypothetical protein
MSAVDALETSFASQIGEPWTSGEVILAVASGSRGLQARYVAPGGERKGSTISTFLDAACNGVIAALELE